MATSQAVKRLQKEYSDMRKNPTPHIEAHPEHNNILTWYFLIDGPRDSPYEGGEYLGRIQLPPDYPFKAPQFYVVTPNGRFETDTSICLSYSQHHQSTWSPVWSIPKMIQGLLSFMLESDKALGTMESDDKTKKQLAIRSLEFNLGHPKFGQLFPARMEALVNRIVRASPTSMIFAGPTASKLPSVVLEKYRACVAAVEQERGKNQPQQQQQQLENIKK